jgi:hypothetical protein
MNESTAHSGYERIDAVLHRVAKQLPRLPDWYDSLRSLGAASPDERRLRVYQSVRDEGTLSEQQGAFPVIFTLDQIATRMAGLECKTLEDNIARLAAIFVQAATGSWSIAA